MSRGVVAANKVDALRIKMERKPRKLAANCGCTGQVMPKLESKEPQNAKCLIGFALIPLLRFVFWPRVSSFVLPMSVARIIAVPSKSTAETVLQWRGVVRYLVQQDAVLQMRLSVRDAFFLLVTCCSAFRAFSLPTLLHTPTRDMTLLTATFKARAASAASRRAVSGLFFDASQPTQTTQTVYEPPLFPCVPSTSPLASSVPRSPSKKNGQAFGQVLSTRFAAPIRYGFTNSSFS